MHAKGIVAIRQPFTRQGIIKVASRGWIKETRSEYNHSLTRVTAAIVASHSRTRIDGKDEMVAQVTTARVLLGRDGPVVVARQPLVDLGAKVLSVQHLVLIQQGRVLSL